MKLLLPITIGWASSSTDDLNGVFKQALLENEKRGATVMAARPKDSLKFLGFQRHETVPSCGNGAVARGEVQNSKVLSLGSWVLRYSAGTFEWYHPGLSLGRWLEGRWEIHMDAFSCKKHLAEHCTWTVPSIEDPIQWKHANCSRVASGP